MKWEINGAARGHVQFAPPVLGFTIPDYFSLIFNIDDNHFIMWTEILFMPGKEAFVKIIVSATNLLAQPRSLYENKLCRSYT